MKPAPDGTRVLVVTGLGAGRTGTVTTLAPGLLNGHDIAVHLDELDTPLCYFWRELAPEVAAS